MYTTLLVYNHTTIFPWMKKYITHFLFFRKREEGVGEEGVWGGWGWMSPLDII